jgi:hypothetical protein
MADNKLAEILRWHHGYPPIWLELILSEVEEKRRNVNWMQWSILLSTSLTKVEWRVISSPRIAGKETILAF